MSALAGCAAVFLPADPPRSSTVAFWHPHGAEPLPDDPSHHSTPLTVVLPATAEADPTGHAETGDARPGPGADDGSGTGDGARVPVRLRSVPAVVLPV
ncbi:hypothetical protein, partial [Streptomyces sparsus]